MTTVFVIDDEREMVDLIARSELDARSRHRLMPQVPEERRIMQKIEQTVRRMMIEELRDSGQDWRERGGEGKRRTGRLLNYTYRGRGRKVLIRESG